MVVLTVKINHMHGIESYDYDFIGEIQAIKSEIAAMGANGPEVLGDSNDIDNIVLRLQNGEITPQEALAEAVNIRDSKNSNF